MERENVCDSQENDVRRRCAAIVNHRAIVKMLRVVNLLCVVFLVRRGPLGKVSLEIFKFGLQNSPTKKGTWWVTCLKFSIALEIFNPGGRS